MKNCSLKSYTELLSKEKLIYIAYYPSARQIAIFSISSLTVKPFQGLRLRSVNACIEGCRWRAKRDGHTKKHSL